MKINDIILETPLPPIELPGDVPVKDWHQEKVGNDDVGDFKHLGRGVEANVLKDPHNPGVVKVVGSKVSLRESAYLQYILIARNYAAQNPYLPRIESIQRDVVKSDGPTAGWRPAPIKEYFVVRLEELVPLKKATAEDIFFMAKTLFKNDSFENNLIMALDSNINDFNARKEFARYVDSYIRMRRMPTDIDKNFIAVANLIKRIVSKTNGFLDVHSDNIMMRRTPYGPQLVLSDPVYRGPNADF